MKKKVLSIMLSSALAVTAVPQFVFAAAPTDYEITQMKTVETMLTELNVDASDADVAAKTFRDEQLAAIEAKVAAFNSDADLFTYASKWDNYISAVNDAEAQERVKHYMQLRYISKYAADFGTSGAELKSKLDAIDSDSKFNTADQSLKESNSVFNAYRNAVNKLYEDYAADTTLFKAAGELAKESAAESFEKFEKQSLLDSTKNLIALAFASKGDEAVADSFHTRYFDEFMKNDKAKKDLAVFFGQGITSELATGAVVEKVKTYLGSLSGTELTDTKKLVENVFAATAADAVTAAHKLIGTLVFNAYEGDALQSGAKKLFGDGTDKGAVELAMNVADADNSMSNLWINLFIRRFVQMTSAGIEMNTISKATPDSPIEIANGTSGDFVLKNLEEYGVKAELCPNTACFAVVSDAADVTYSSADGEFRVNYNSALAEKYPAKITVYRKAFVSGSEVLTYIEDYPVTVVNVARRPSYNRGGTTAKNYEVKLIGADGGTISGKTSVPAGSDQQYIIKPNPGYTIGKILVDGVEYTDYTVDADNKAVITLKDINENHQIEAEYVKLLTDDTHMSYILGYPDGQFKPNGNITREETATIFFRLLTKDARDRYLTAATSFDDVEADRWSAKAIGTLAKMSIVNGYGDGTFMPSKNITRAEFASIAYKFYKLSYSGDDKFGDISGHWAAGSINAIAEVKWLEGYEDGTFKPEQAITRAEAVTIINRMLSRAVTTENIASGAAKFSDCNESDWYYNAVIEASNSHDYEETRLEDGTEKWTEITTNPDWSSYEK